MGAGQELVARRKNGEEFPADLSLSPIETEEGQLVAAAIRDVSDRKRADEAQAWLASIVQSSHDAIVGKSLDGAISSWNPGAERLYGYTAEEMIGRPLDVVIPPDSQDEEAAMLERVMLGKSVEEYQYAASSQERPSHRRLGHTVGDHPRQHRRRCGVDRPRHHRTAAGRREASRPARRRTRRRARARRRRPNPLGERASRPALRLPARRAHRPAGRDPRARYPGHRPRLLRRAGPSPDGIGDSARARAARTARSSRRRSA